MRRAPSLPVAEYLLDTGLIRSLNSTEEQMLVESRQRYRFTTSFIAPLEMLWHMPRVGTQNYQEEYRFRRAGLAKYEKVISFGLTYWDDEDVIIAAAFGVTRPCTNKRPLQSLIQACISCGSLEELEDAIPAIRAKGGLISSLDELREMREDKRKEYRVILEKAVDRMRHAPVDTQSGSRRASILADWARRHVLKDALTNRYDGSLDLYAQAYVVYSSEIAMGKKAPGSRTDNDPYDITQLCYLRSNDPNQYFVTTDQALLRVAEEATPNRVVDKPTFLACIT